MKVSITVNGSVVERDVDPRTLLVHFLREELDLTGTKIGCDTSQCGACTVHMNGKALKSCTCLTAQADGQDVVTIEGLGQPESLHPMQESFWEKHGLQCGYCTPGMIMATTAYVKNNPKATEHDVRHNLEGNICRCTGYQNIVAAVAEAAGKMGGGD